MAQKWANNDILISGGTYLGPKLKKKKPLSSIFDIEAPFQRYLPKSEILPILGSGRLRRESAFFSNFLDEIRSDDPDLQRSRTSM